MENRLLRRIFGPKRDEITGEWRKLHNEEPNDMYSSPYIIRMIKSRRMRWTGHVARKGERRGTYGVLVGKLEERDNLEDVYRRIILRKIFRKWNGGTEWVDLSQDRVSWRALIYAVMIFRVP
jgi:hypothetical protein